MTNQMAPTEPIALEHTFESEQGALVHGSIGSGPPLVLVHGTPSWSYLWRHVASQLAERFTVHLYDMPGYGHSAMHEGQDVSISAQARTLARLVDYLGLDRPAIVGHDIGGAIVLGAALLEGAAFSAVTLLDAVVTKPWITDNTRHQKRWLEAYVTAPRPTFERLARGHLATAFHTPPPPAVLDRYMEPWHGPEGQAAWYRKIDQFDEAISDEIVPRLAGIDVPVQVVWGESDAWLSRDVAHSIVAASPPGTPLHILERAGHFSPEDNPDDLVRLVADFAGA